MVGGAIKGDAALVVDFEGAEAPAKGLVVGLWFGGRAAVVDAGADCRGTGVGGGSHGAGRSAGGGKLFFELDDAFFESLGV